MVKKRLLASIEYKLETINNIFNTMVDVTSKTMLLLSTTQVDEVAQKDQLKREQKVLQDKLDTY